jgi:hypothetical protein
MSWIRSLLSKSEQGVDSAVVASYLAMFGLVLSQLFDLYHHHDFNALTFGTGAAAIIGALTAGKGYRDSVTPVGSPPMLPEKPSDMVAAEGER